MKIKFSDEITIELMDPKNKHTHHLFWIEDGERLVKVTAKVLNRGSRNGIVRKVGFDFSHTGFYISEKGREILNNKDYTCSKYTITMHLLVNDIVTGMHILRLGLHSLDIFEREG